MCFRTDVCSRSRVRGDLFKAGAAALWVIAAFAAGCDDETKGDDGSDTSAQIRTRDASENERLRDVSPLFDAHSIADAVVPPAPRPDSGPHEPDAATPPPPPTDAAAPPPVDDAAAPPPPRDVAPPPPTPDAAPPPPPPGVSPECRAALADAEFTFEDGAEGWTHAELDGVEGDWPIDGWNRGPLQSGPGQCFEGAQCWATHINGNYVQCQRAELRSPVIDLRPCADYDVELVFDHWYDFWAGDDGFDIWYDGGTLEAANSGEYFEIVDPDAMPGVIRINPSIGDYECLRARDFYVHGLPGYVLRSDGWVEVRASLDDMHRIDTFQMRFIYGSGVSQPTDSAVESQQSLRPGWYVDHLRFEIR